MKLGKIVKFRKKWTILNIIRLYAKINFNLTYQNQACINEINVWLFKNFRKSSTKKTNETFSFSHYYMKWIRDFSWGPISSTRRKNDWIMGRIAYFFSEPRCKYTFLKSFTQAYICYSDEWGGPLYYDRAFNSHV